MVANLSNEAETSLSGRERRFSDKQIHVPARIFVAEDDDEMRLLLYEAFVYDGYEVVDLASGQELFDLLRRAIELGKEPDIFVSDIRMPGMTGLEILNRIRKLGSKIPAVLITAFGDEETLNEASKLGATAVFNKPFDIDDLRMAVAYFVADRLKCNTHHSEHPK